MDDHMGSLMADATSSIDPSMNTFTNNNSAQQSSQGTPMPMQPQQAPQTTTLHPSQTNVSSVDYSSNMDSLNFLPLVSSNSPPQTLSSGSNQDPYNTTLMPIVAPQSQQMSTSSTISDEAVAQIVSNTSVPEFLYQLTKMLTDDHREIIEWSNAKIEVHNPHRLESEVLNKYFRHSKYASFQRQLNYFGFRKLAGKGKMAPCSYVNENATTDLRSLLRMKRKTSATTKDSKTESSADKKKSTQSGRIVPISKVQGVKRSRNGANTGPAAKIAVGKGVRHQLNGYLRHPSAPQSMDGTGGYDQVQQNSTDPSSIAKSAVGKGIAHHHTFSNPGAAEMSKSTANAIRGNNLDGFKQHRTDGNNFTFLDPSQLGMGIDNSLSELQSNYQSSLNDSDQANGTANGSGNHNRSSLRRDSSLVALAMIPSLQSIEPTPVSELEAIDDKAMMTFIDFPNTGYEQLGLNLDNMENKS